MSSEVLNFIRPLPFPCTSLTLLAAILSPVQAVVMELVCCPANREAMSRPQISSSVVLRPLYTFWRCPGSQKT